MLMEIEFRDVKPGEVFTLSEDGCSIPYAKLDRVYEASEHYEENNMFEAVRLTDYSLHQMCCMKKVVVEREVI